MPVNQKNKTQFMDRYQALGIPYPDPKTMCKGQCEGTGWIPHKHTKLYKDSDLQPVADPSDKLYDQLWEEAEKVAPTDDGWHFLKCPDCNGTGKDTNE